MEMTLIIYLIGGVTLAILMVLAIAEIRRPKSQKDRIEPKLYRSKKKVVLTRKNSRPELLAVLADKDCDYPTMVSALKFLGLANGNSQLVFHPGDCEKFGTNGLMEIANRFWALRWPKISQAKCAEEISLAAKGLIDDLGFDPRRLDGLIEIIKQKCEAEIAEAMEAEILVQGEERQQKLKEEILPFKKKRVY